MPSVRQKKSSAFEAISEAIHGKLQTLEVTKSGFLPVSTVLTTNDVYTLTSCDFHVSKVVTLCVSQTFFEKGVSLCVNSTISNS